MNQPKWKKCRKACTCWTWDILYAALADNPKIFKRVKAAQATCGIWEHLPPFEFEEE